MWFVHVCFNFEDSLVLAEDLTDCDMILFDMLSILQGLDNASGSQIKGYWIRCRSNST